MSAPLTQQQINVDMSVAFQTSTFDLQQARGFSVQVFYSGSPNGTLLLEGRNADGAAFITLPGSAYTQAITAAGNQMFEYSNCEFKEVRLNWAPTGGSGSLSAYWFAKRLT